MAQEPYQFWTCPGCVHAREVDLASMASRCRLIDQGESPIDGKAWEYQDRDSCPVFEPTAERKEVCHGG